MNKPQYLYKTEAEFTIFEFVSEGPKGSIKKIVEYTETATENVYNLGFGDYDETTNSINDLSVTNNGDSLKGVQFKTSHLAVKISNFAYRLQ